MTYPPQHPVRGGWERPAGEPVEGLPEQNQQPAFYGNESTGMPQGTAANPGAAAPPETPGTTAEPAAPTAAPPPFSPAGPRGGEPRPRRRGGLRWAFAGAGALVVAGAAVGGYLVYRGDSALPRPGARPVAQQVVDKVNAGDFGGLRGTLCRENRADLDRQLAQLSTGRFALRLGPVTEQGDEARAEVTGVYELAGSNGPVRQTVVLRAEAGQWKVCDLTG